jgi:hypothetical protein
MSDNCFYKMLGEEFGPVSADDLRDMIRTGQLAGNDEVRMDKGRPWQRVSEVAELNLAESRDGGPGSDRFTPQKTRGLFSSVSESVAGTSSGGASGSSSLDEFHDLSELMIDSGDSEPAPPPARTPAANPRTQSSRFATPSGPAKAPASAPTATPKPLQAKPSSPPSTPAAKAPPTPAPVVPVPAARVHSPAAPAPGVSPVGAMPLPAAPLPFAAIPVAPMPVAPMPVMPVQMGYSAPAAPVVVPAAAPVAEDAQWYCWTNNQQYGPVAIDTLVEWAKAGRLTPKDHVKFGENGDWFESGSVEELFSTPKKAAAGKGLAEIKVQSREEFQQEKADLVAASPVAEVKKDTEKPAQKFEPLFTKDMLKKVTEKKSAGGGIQINLSKNAQLAILLSVLAVVGAVVYLPSAGINIGKLFGGGNSWEMGIYQKLRSHHTKLTDFRSKNDSAGWEKYAKDVESEINGYRKSLEKSAGAKYPARQQLLFAVKDHWKAMVSDSASKPGPGEEQFDKALSSARKILQKR